MGLTDREAYLDLRGRYLRLVTALRLTREYNPGTLEAIEGILEHERLNGRCPYPPMPMFQKPQERQQHAA